VNTHIQDRFPAPIKGGYKGMNSSTSPLDTPSHSAGITASPSASDNSATRPENSGDISSTSLVSVSGLST